jgi:hypothetical protein
MKTPRRRAFDRELASAVDLMNRGCRTEAFACLERAHVLGQEQVVPHVLAHFLMLRIEIQRRDVRAALGQVLRVALGALGSLIGIVPRGNTGGTDVNMFSKMPIAPELAALIQPDEAAGAQHALHTGAARNRIVPYGAVLLVGAVLGAVLYAYAPEFMRTPSTEPPMNFVPSFL